MLLVFISKENQELFLEEDGEMLSFGPLKLIGENKYSNFLRIEVKNGVLFKKLVWVWY